MWHPRILVQPWNRYETVGSNFYNVLFIADYNMTERILAQNDVIFSMAAGLNRLHMPGVK